MPNAHKLREQKKDQSVRQRPFQYFNYSPAGSRTFK